MTQLEKQKLREIKKKIYRKSKLACFQEGVFAEKNPETEEKAVIWLRIYNSLNDKMDYYCTSNKVKWSKKALLEGYLPGSMFPPKLKTNFVASLGIDRFFYELTDEEKNFINNLDISK